MTTPTSPPSALSTGPGRRRRSAVLGLAGLTGLAATLVTAPAGAAPGRSLPPITATAVATTTPGAPACDPTGRCVVPWQSTSAVTGGLQGEALSFGSLVTDDPAAGTYTSTHYALFTGAVEGCGSGTVVFYFPPVAGSPGAFRGRIEVHAGSGTGDLAGLRGSGTYQVTPSATGSLTELTLKLRCPR